MKEPFRGNFPARIDDKGRLKIPSGFRSLVEDQYGHDVFVTSVSGEYARIYPMAVWLTIESKLVRVPTTHPSRTRFVDRVNFFGQPAELDRQGRVLIHARLRESAGISGEVAVLGEVSYLDVWNHDRFMAKLQRERFTDEDALALAEYGI